jgi:hypothetical protein
MSDASTRAPSRLAFRTPGASRAVPTRLDNLANPVGPLELAEAKRNEDFQSRVRSEKWSCARRSSRDARDEGPLADDVIRNGLAWLQRNPSVTPAWVSAWELGGMIWGQFSANSAVPQSPSE